MSTMKDIEGNLRCAIEMVLDPALYERDERGQLAVGLQNALPHLEQGEVRTARRWLRHFLIDFESDHRFARILAHDKRKVTNNWNSARAFVDWALEHLPHLEEVQGEGEEE